MNIKGFFGILVLIFGVGSLAGNELAEEKRTTTCDRLTALNACEHFNSNLIHDILSTEIRGAEYCCKWEGERVVKKCCPKYPDSDKLGAFYVRCDPGYTVDGCKKCITVKKRSVKCHTLKHDKPDGVFMLRRCCKRGDSPKTMKYQCCVVLNVIGKTLCDEEDGYSLNCALKPRD